MEKKIYISDEERGKCKKVANAFAELYEVRIFRWLMHEQSDTALY